MYILLVDMFFCYSPILIMAFYHQILLHFLEANKNNTEITVRQSVDLEKILSFECIWIKRLDTVPYIPYLIKMSASTYL